MTSSKVKFYHTIVSSDPVDKVDMGIWAKVERSLVEALLEEHQDMNRTTAERKAKEEVRNIRSEVPCNNGRDWI